MTRQGPSSPYTYDWTQAGPVATLASNFSGITLDIYSDQEVCEHDCLRLNVYTDLDTTGFPDVLLQWPERFLDAQEHPGFLRQ